MTKIKARKVIKELEPIEKKKALTLLQTLELETARETVKHVYSLDEILISGGYLIGTVGIILALIAGYGLY